MKEIIREAAAGTVESSDALVQIMPADSLELEIESVVLPQYGEAIRAAALETLGGLGVTKAHVRILDRGALDCVIRARVETAALRASEVEA